MESIALNKIASGREQHCCEASSEKSLYINNLCSRLKVTES